MINVLIGIFYIALIALISYLFYYIIKIAIKDAYYELKSNSCEIKNIESCENDNEQDIK